MTTIREAINQASTLLQKQGIHSPALDARIILQHVLAISHEEIILNSNKNISKIDQQLYDKLIKKRTVNTPVSYITGKKEFYSKTFIVNEYTLLPRPDTETIVEYCCKLFAKDYQIKILDIGTGSGCIAICLADNYKDSEVIATDCSVDALTVAKKNAATHQVDINFIKDNNFSSTINEKFDLIISNPPYIKTDDINNLSRDVKEYEPHTALDGGKDGLDAYRVIISQAVTKLKPKGYLVFEIGMNQHQEIQMIAKENGFKLQEQVKDLAGIIRCISFTKI
ncbi:MAG: peptide chain release factor N(5)-glutamine methyltransferase [Rickettsiales bacterium]